MRYTPRNINEEETEETLPPYISDQTAFIKYVTQVDPIPGVIDTKFLRKHALWNLFAGKIKALAFINNPKTIKHNHCIRNSLSLELEAGLYDLAEEDVWISIDNMQITRGTRGNLQKALITQRRVLEEIGAKEQRERKGLWGRVFKGQQEMENMEFMMGD